MDTEEKYVTSYELTERNQQELLEILTEDKHVITLEGWKDLCDLCVKGLSSSIQISCLQI